ncbi:hypothetical protein FA15DRAFT_753625 [Coprinopsis marcescibilis]|uniref:Uncharacterized protein n=1 Tax=Coprinopsis marcescibilis TaxID=230819 RepID=A0A5C3L6E8_COPMA|nr:hypothetical protein FA15DRAFT_753625 [Coprinopsis marcescibilis]
MVRITSHALVAAAFAISPAISAPIFQAAEGANGHFAREVSELEDFVQQRAISPELVKSVFKNFGRVFTAFGTTATIGAAVATAAKRKQQPQQARRAFFDDDDFEVRDLYDEDIDSRELLEDELDARSFDDEPVYFVVRGEDGLHHLVSRAINPYHIPALFHKAAQAIRPHIPTLRRYFLPAAAGAAGLGVGVHSITKHQRDLEDDSDMWARGYEHDQYERSLEVLD